MKQANRKTTLSTKQIDDGGTDKGGVSFLDLHF